MQRDQVLDTLRGLKLALNARGVVRAGLFGSTARLSAQPSSDVDIVVATAPDCSIDLIGLGAVSTLLEEALNAKVDLLLEPIGDPKLAAAVARERIDAF